MKSTEGRTLYRRALGILSGLALSCAQTVNAVGDDAHVDAGRDLGRFEDATVEDAHADASPPRDVTAQCDTAECGQRAINLHVGAYLAQARLADGRTVGWGWNNAGQLGQGDFHLGPRPVAIPPESRLFLGHSIDCRIDPDHSLWCWGLDIAEVLGTRQRAVDRGPTTARLIMTGVVDVAVGDGILCAVREDLHVDCIGTSDNFSIGSEGNPGIYRIPMRVNGVAGVTRMSQSTSPDGTFCAFSARETYCWGRAHLGLFGDGVRYGTPPRLLPSWAGATRIDVDNIACSLDAMGLVGCAGSGIDRFTGAILGFTARSAQVRTIMQGLPPMTDFAVGGYTLCGVDYEGAVWCTGNNQAGQVGVEMSETWLPPRRVSLVGVAEQVGCGMVSCCARLRSGQVWCWGENPYGQLGRPRAELAYSFVPVRVTWE
ncbi:MAG: hypothetical protein R3A48_26990 [Polyangiales bacterium]